jgi:hypothetical protein
MRKIYCDCGAASFMRVCALFDMQETPEDAKDVSILEKVFAYKCLTCGKEYRDEEIEHNVANDFQRDRVTLIPKEEYVRRPD